VLPLAACVPTLPKAVEISLANGWTADCLFIFSRALLAFEVTAGINLTAHDLKGAFALWWNSAKAFLPADADYDEYRFTFEDGFAKVRAPWGSNPLAEAIRRADSSSIVPYADRYTSPRIKRVLGVCFHLQALAHDSPFFLSVRDVARIAGIKDLAAASTLPAGLVRDGVLVEVEKGIPGGRRATRYRFKHPSSASPI
jgi:hypothetical protein